MKRIWPIFLCGLELNITAQATGLDCGKAETKVANIGSRSHFFAIFDDEIFNLDQQTAERFAQAINRLKGKVTMIFIAHQVPKGLQVDEVVNMGRHAMHMSLVKEEI